MAESLSIDGSGNLTFQSNATVANTLTITIGGGTTYNFTSSATGQAITLGSGTSGWSGGGTNATGPISTVTGTITVNEGTGSGARTCQIENVNNAVIYNGTATSNQVAACSNGVTASGTIDNIGGDVTFNASAGTTAAVVSNQGGSTNYGPISWTAGKVSGFGPHNFFYAKTSGTFSTIRFIGSNNFSNTITINSPGVGPFRWDGGNSGNTINVVAVDQTATINGGSASDVFTLGTAAGSSAGLDGFTATSTINGNGSANSLRVDDTGSATGNKTYTITFHTIACSSFSTVTFLNTGGSFANGLRFDGSSVGGNTFAVTSNPTDNATIAGNGGNTNTLDIHTLSSWTLSDNGDGTGTVTESSTKTITYSGMQYVTPYFMVTPGVTGTPQVGQTLTCDGGTAVGGSGGVQSRAYLWKHGDGSAAAGSATASTYVPVAGDVGFTMVCQVTATNAGGSTAATSTATGTVLPAAPVADFSGTPTSGTSPLSVVFTDLSTNTPTSWLWEKNSGSGWVNFSGTPTAQDPTESFTSGTWSVRLTATNTGGSNTKTRTNYIVPRVVSGGGHRLLLMGCS